jgi:uncharacterized membrane protein
MTWIYIICGFVIGGMLADSTGFIVGAIIGYLLSMVSQNKQQLVELSHKFHLLEMQLSVTKKSDIGASKSVNETVTAVPDVAEVPDYIPAQPIETEDTKVVAASVQADFSTKESEPRATEPDPWREPEKEPQKKPMPIDVVTDYVDDYLNKAITLVKNFFREGNLIVTIGVIVLFVGASFLIKYSIDNSLIAIELRLAGLVFGSLVILIVGWRLREKSPGYALIMQGGAVAIIYLSIFASFKLYGLLPATVAFPLLILFSALSMFLAVSQDSRALAVTAITGGFVSPILASTGTGSHIGLFSFYLVLNLGIFGVSWFKSWRMLNLLGFAFTFVIGILWGVTRYKAEYFATTEPFLIAFFLIYVAIAILFAMKQKPHLKGYVDASLVFGVPLLAFGLQGALVYNIEYGLAWSAFAVGFFYLTVARVLWNNTNSNYRLLCEAMLALGVIFTTLTIPLALDGRWTAASWAIEGAGLVWIGLRQSRQLVKAFGLLIQIAGGLLFIFDYSYNNEAMAFINGQYMGSVMVAIAGFITAYMLSQTKETDAYDNPTAMLFLFWSLGWWYIGGLSQITFYLGPLNELLYSVIFVTISALLWLYINIRYPRNIFKFFPWLLLLPLWYGFAITPLYSHVFANYGFIAWPIALAAAYSIYWICEKKQIVLLATKHLHTATYLLVTAVLAYESYWILGHNGFAGSWSVSAVALVIILALQLINRLNVWPMKQYPQSYQKWSAIILIGGLLLWSLLGNFIQFLVPKPLPYITLLNPIDLVQGLALFSIIEWHVRSQTLGSPILDKQTLYKIVGGFCFIWFNVILLKTIHLLTGVAYSPGQLFDSVVVQMAISISWTIIGLIIMVLASKKLHRQLWFVGGALTGVVVIKLFLLDQNGSGTIERIVTFMIVGVLLLVVGYFSPVPPSQKAVDGKESS